MGNYSHVTQEATPEDDFAKIPNSFARCPHVKPGPRAVLLNLASHRTGWGVTYQEVAKQVGSNPKSVRSWLIEAEASTPYLRSEETGLRDPGGHPTKDYFVSLTARCDACEVIASAENPTERITSGPRERITSGSSPEVNPRERISNPTERMSSHQGNGLVRKKTTKEDQKKTIPASATNGTDYVQPSEPCGECGRPGNQKHMDWCSLFKAMHCINCTRIVKLVAFAKGSTCECGHTHSPEDLRDPRSRAA